jgi:hypothetical protein
MWGIRVAGEYLDIAPDATIRIEEYNTMYLGGDIDRYLQPRTLPVDVPATQHNVRLLNRAHLIQSSGYSFRSMDAELWVEGDLYRKGTLWVMAASPQNYSVMMAFSQYYALNNLTLPQIDLGGLRDIGSGLTGPGSIQEHLKLTAENPDDYDYTFIPITNYGKFDSGEDPADIGQVAPADGWWQNQYTTNNYNNINNTTLGAHSPNVKLSYLLERIFAAAGMSLDNQFQTDEELQRLYLYSNQTIIDADNLVMDQIWLNEHVPDMLCKDYLRSLINRFNLCFAKDPNEAHVTIYSARELLSLAPLYDWSRKMLSDHMVKVEYDYPGTFADSDAVRYEEPFFDSVERNLDRYIDMGEVDTEGDVPGVGATDPERYYVRSRESHVVRIPLLSNFRPYYSAIEELVVEKDRSRLSSQIGTMIMTPISQINKPGPHKRYTPWLSYPLSIRSLEQRHPVPNKLLFYRGFHPDPGSPAFNRPTGSTSVYDYDEQRLWDYSLYWRGDHGVYNTFWKPWIDVIRAGRTVECSLALTSRDVRDLQIWRRVHIRGSSFMIKKLDITIGRSGIQPVQATLICTDHVD